MTGFKPRTSAVGSNRSTNWATITAQMLVLFYIKFLWGSPKVAAVVRANNISTGSLVRTNDVTRRGRKKSFRPHFFVQQKLWKLVSTKIPFLTSPHCVRLGPIISTCPGMRERERWKIDMRKSERTLTIGDSIPVWLVSSFLKECAIPGLFFIYFRLLKQMPI